MKVEPHKSSLGMNANLWAMLLYLITIGLSYWTGMTIAAWVFPLVFYFVEKKSDFIKFHAKQLVAMYAVNGIIQLVLAIVTAVVIGVSGSALGLLGFGWGFGIGAYFAVGALYAVGYIIITIFAIFSIIGAVKAWNYEEWRIPLFADLAGKFEVKHKKQ